MNISWYFWFRPSMTVYLLMSSSGHQRVKSFEVQPEIFQRRSVQNSSDWNVETVDQMRQEPSVLVAKRPLQVAPNNVPSTVINIPVLVALEKCMKDERTTARNPRRKSGTMTVSSIQLTNRFSGCNLIFYKDLSCWWCSVERVITCSIYKLIFPL